MHFSVECSKNSKEHEMADQAHPHGTRGMDDDQFKMYASPVGARIMQRANKIYEDFPTTRYILYFALFSVEVVVVLLVGLSLIR
jgi:hypothetical protein